MRGRILLIATATVVALASGAIAAASNSRASHTARSAQRLYNPGDQALARSIVLNGSDLGPTSSWRGGRTVPETTEPRTCANFHPRQSDLVITGDAQSDYVSQTSGVAYHDEAQVMKTPHMVKLDWQRNVLDPAALPCLASSLSKGLPAGEQLISLTRLSVPRIATYTAGYRALIDQHVAQQPTVRTMIDVLFVGRGRTEITLETSAPYASRAEIKQSELRLARLLIARSPARS